MSQWKILQHHFRQRSAIIILIALTATLVLESVATYQIILGMQIVLLSVTLSSVVLSVLALFCLRALPQMSNAIAVRAVPAGEILERDVVPFQKEEVFA
ncbi:MAG: hypothetical protein ACRDHZ_13155, partial [Ktedonobacteraceae bacterium]